MYDLWIDFKGNMGILCFDEIDLKTLKVVVDSIYSWHEFTNFRIFLHKTKKILKFSNVRELIDFIEEEENK